jgi:hypothetical protein
MFFVEAPQQRFNRPVAIDQETSGAGASVAMTLVGVASHRHYVAEVLWSYNAAPTGGRLTISGLQGGEVLDIDITASGPGPLLLPPLAGAAGTSVVITLAGGGGAVVGKLTVFSTLLPTYPS